ncbi:MAG: putative bifunctional diguanylate cyclase/phosphodiesterase [Acetatifactor sp.]
MNELQYQVDLLKAMNQKLTEKERMHAMAFQATEGVFLYYSFEKDHVETMGNWNEYFNFQVHEIKDISGIMDYIDEAYQLPLRDALFPEKVNKNSGAAECKMKDKLCWIGFRTLVSYDQKGKPTEKIIYIKNITKVKTQSEELTFMAYYDNLTGLYNRNYFVRLLSEYVNRAAESHSIVSVMTIDIDEFRKVNDGMGIIVGDELVQQFGFFLKSIGGDDIITCHLHSDVFCLAIYEPVGSKSVDNVYKEIIQRLKEPFRISTGQSIKITVSIGVAEYPEAAMTALELINCAEIVVYKCKKQGKNMLQYFQPPMLDDFLHSIELEDKLKKAVENKTFFMCYQPQYFSGNRRLRGVEALIRWKDESAQFISPNVFIPVAEKNGSIIPIGQWVVEESIRQYATWRSQFGFPFIMSINISALQYKKDDFADSIVEVLNKYNVKPNEIELEITEGVLIDDFVEVSKKLKVLRDYGIRIALDDFGTGFSSLSYLKQLPIDSLKIDKSFIDTVLSDSATRVITESIVNMVKTLGFESIAEGVEEEQQYNYLYSVGCDVIQGYLFGKPLLPDEMEAVLAEAKQ